MMLRNNINVFQLGIKWLNKMVDPPVPFQIYIFYIGCVWCVHVVLLAVIFGFGFSQSCLLNGCVVCVCCGWRG